MNYTKFLLNFILSICLLALNLILFNVLLSGGFFRWDLTADKEYTISETTKRIVGNLGDRLIVRGYFSKELPSAWTTLPGKIRDICEEYGAYSRGMLKVEFVDPGEDPVARQEALEQFGIQEHTFEDQSRTEYALRKCFFSMVVLYGDRHKLLPLSALYNIKSLEYELTAAIKSAVFGFQSIEALFAKMKGKMFVKGYISEKNLPESVENVPTYLETVCKEFKEKAGEKFDYEIVDPKEDMGLQEEILKSYGIRPVYTTFPPDPEKMVYLSAIIEMEGRKMLLPLQRKDLTPNSLRQSFEGVIKRMVPGFLKTVGLMSPDPDLPPDMRMQMQEPAGEFNNLRKVLETEFTVRPVSLKGGQPVPDEIDVLMVIKPKELTEAEKYAIDQYIMQGGPLILCINGAEFQQVSVDPRNPFQRGSTRLVKVNTNLDDMLAYWGITIKPEIVLDKRCLSQTQAVPDPRNPRNLVLRHTEYPFFIRIERDSLDTDHLIVSQLENLQLFFASPVDFDRNKNTDVKATELVKSSEQSWTNTNFETVLSTAGEKVIPPETCTPQPLAVALVGKFKSYYSGKEIPSVKREEPPEEERSRVPKREPPVKPPFLPPSGEKKGEKEPESLKEKSPEEKKPEGVQGGGIEKTPEKKENSAGQGEGSKAAFSAVAPGFVNILPLAAILPAPPLQDEKEKEGKKKEEIPREPEVAPSRKAGEEERTQITLEESPETRIIVVGNADFVSDVWGFQSSLASSNAKFLFNMLDWALLDNDMISIRSRGATNRALEEVSSNKKLLVEILNYTLPVGLVILFGIVRLILRRRQALASLVSETRPLGSIRTAREEEARFSGKDREGFGGEKL